jgi:hypothetical protein
MKFSVLRQPGHAILNGRDIVIAGFEHPAQVLHVEELTDLNMLPRIAASMHVISLIVSIHCLKQFI